MTLEQSSKLSREQFTTLLTEVNDGIIPTDKDLDYVIAQCDLSGDGCVEMAQMKAALACWLCLAEEAALPATVEAAKEMGYTDDQIEKVMAASKEAEAAAEAARDGAAELKAEGEDAAASLSADAASPEAAPAAVESAPAAEAPPAAADAAATEPAAATAVTAAPAAEAAAPAAEAPADYADE